MKINIAMEWDGETPTADLIIDGMPLTGSPHDIQHVFDTLNGLRDRCKCLEDKLDRLSTALATALDDIGGLI